MNILNFNIKDIFYLYVDSISGYMNYYLIISLVLLIVLLLNFFFIDYVLKTYFEEYQANSKFRKLFIKYYSILVIIFIVVVIVHFILLYLGR